MTPALPAAAALLIVLGLAACGGEEPVEMPTVDGVASVAPGLQVRPVLDDAADVDCADQEADGPPGNRPAEDEVVLCGVDGGGQRLGPAAVVGGVERARAVPLRGVPGVGGFGLAIRLEKQAAQALAELAADASSSDSRLALVVDGLVVTSPTVASTIGGRLLLVGGQYTRAQAEDYVARIAP